MGLQSCHSNALMSMFRLVRGLEREDLSEIDALLGCPLVMPSRKTIDEFDMLSPEQQIVVVDSLFHAVNWFREVINCFSYLIKQNDGHKVNHLKIFSWSLQLNKLMHFFFFFFVDSN